VSSLFPAEGEPAPRSDCRPNFSLTTPGSECTLSSPQCLDFEQKSGVACIQCRTSLFFLSFLPRKTQAVPLDRRASGSRTGRVPPWIPPPMHPFFWRELRTVPIFPLFAPIFDFPLLSTTISDFFSSPLFLFMDRPLSTREEVLVTHINLFPPHHSFSGEQPFASFDLK